MKLLLLRLASNNHQQKRLARLLSMAITWHRRNHSAALGNLWKCRHDAIGLSQKNEDARGTTMPGFVSAAWQHLQPGTCHLPWTTNGTYQTPLHQNPSNLLHCCLGHCDIWTTCVYVAPVVAGLCKACGNRKRLDFVKWVGHHSWESTGLLCCFWLVFCIHGS